MTRDELTMLWEKVTGKIGYEIDELIDGAPEALDTLKEIADKLSDDDDAIAALVNSIAAKQDALVSGTNIKTINSTSLLGSGDLSIAEEQLPNKTYAPAEFSGLGRKYLQKNIVSDKNVLTQAMVSEANTEFIVQYDYDLNDPNGENPITIPANCALKFEGGSINNGKIVFQDTSLESCKECFGDDLVIEGKVLQEASPEWFVGSDADKIEKAINTFGVVQLAARDYLIDRTINVQHSFRLNGCGIPSNFGDYTTPSKSYDYSSSRLIPIDDIGSIIACVNPSGRYVSLVLSGVSFVRPVTEPWFNAYKNATTNVTGFAFSTPNGPSRPAVIENCNFKGLAKGIHIYDYDPTLNRSTNISRLRIIGCNISYNGIAIHIEGNNAVGGLHIEDNVIEQNTQYGILAFNAAGSHFETKGVISGIARIVSNLLEGQPNPIYISMTNATLEFKGNYFEDANGATVTVKGLQLVPSRQVLVLDSTVMSSNIGEGVVYDLSNLTLIDNDNPNSAASLSLYNVNIKGTTKKKISGTLISYTPVEGNNVVPFHTFPITPTFIYDNKLAYSTYASGSAFSARLQQAMPAGNYILRAFGKNLVVWLYNLATSPSTLLINEKQMNPSSLSENKLLEYRFTVENDIAANSNLYITVRNDSSFFSGFAIYADDGTGHNLISFDPLDFAYDTKGVVTNPVVGFEWYDKALSKTLRIADIVDGAAVWEDLDGFTPALSRGTTTQRPTLNVQNDNGFKYYDTEISKELFATKKMVAKDETVATLGKSTIYVTNPFLTDGKYVLGITTHGNSYLNIWMSKGNPEESAEDLVKIVNNQASQATVNVTIEDAASYPYLKIENRDSKTLTIKIIGQEELVWEESDGAGAGVLRSGATADRPASSSIYTGFQYWDTTLGKMIAWNGSAWVNLDGTALS